MSCTAADQFSEDKALAKTSGVNCTKLALYNGLDDYDIVNCDNGTSFRHTLYQTL